MSGFFVLDLGVEQRHGYMIGSCLAKSEPAYSPLLDVGFNRQDFLWRDEEPHLHTESDEYYIVLQGRIDLKVNGCQVTTGPFQLVGVRANVPHQVVGGQAPIMSFLIRVPGGKEDKLLSLDSDKSLFEGLASAQEVVQIDLRQRHDDYLLGGCLPPTHLNYSPLLDFTCVWEVEPADEWHHEKLHFHSQREEYYFVLKGSLDFILDNSAISVKAGQILGVRPQCVHKIIGGKGPVDVLFVRVPGGRGDKIVVEDKVERRAGVPL